MAKRAVIWTKTAEKQRREILRYWTERNGTPIYAKKLVHLIAVRIKVIVNFPEAFKATIYPNTRVSAMGHFSILYKFSETQIRVVAFWDNRQAPSKLFAIIKGN